MIYMEILLIALVVVFIIDLSGFVGSVKSFLGRWFGKPASAITIKPFDCSLCSTFWVAIIYALVEKSFSLGVLSYICLIAFMTPVMAAAMRTLFDVLALAVRKLNNFINK